MAVRVGRLIRRLLGRNVQGRDDGAGKGLAPTLRELEADRASAPQTAEHAEAPVLPSRDLERLESFPLGHEALLSAPRSRGPGR